MNPVLILTRNNLELTKRAVESVAQQGIPTELLILDNGSTDGTKEWLSSQNKSGRWLRFSDNSGVSHGWNVGLRLSFEPDLQGSDLPFADHVLVINNDVVLPSWFYRQLLAYDKPFISVVSV